MSKDLSDKRIIECWHENVSPWTKAVRGGEIPSRKLLTNQAIIDAVLALRPTTALDLGCGEGWLSRTLAQHGILTLGVDAVKDLTDAARLYDDKPNGTNPSYPSQSHERPSYKCLSYEQIIDGALERKFDVLVCNFSLLGKESVEGIFSTFSRLLSHQGHVVIQTPHPLGHANENDHCGWRRGSWAGFSDEFSHPAPWYFRTMENWRSLFHTNQLTLVEEVSLTLSGEQTPHSVIFVAQKSITAKP